MATGTITPHKSIAGTISKKTVGGTVVAGGGGGVSDHEKLTNRDAPNQHPISAITNLSQVLDSKLDSETALPLIEEALKTKAKGLWFGKKTGREKNDAWYLTAEVDEYNMGTKESIISGPYNLGAGGGSGGGSTEVVLNIALDPTTGEPMWPYNTSVGSTCVIGVKWASMRDEKPTGRGTMYCYVNEKLVETRSVAQGIVTFDLKEHIVSGVNKVEIKVVDAYNTTKNLIDSINGVTLRLSSTFEDDISYTGDIIFTYTPIGAVKKTVHFILDGKELQPDIVESTGEQKSKLIPAAILQTHGAHNLRVYFTVTLDGEEVRSNELYFDIIWARPGDTTPIIASTYTNTEEEQYTSFTIKYRVYTPGRNKSTIYLETDGVRGDALSVNQAFQLWENRFDTVGDHVLKIITGSVEKTFNIYVKESSIHISPVTDGLELALSSFGRKNSEDPETRCKWDYTNATSTIEGKLTGFNWESNGWVLDDENNTVLRLSGDARLVIEYMPFESDFTASGKTFEFELATSDVKNYETRIMECLDGADSVTYSQGYAGEDTRQNKFRVKEIDSDKFIEKLKHAVGTYIFVYADGAWDLDDTLITQEQLSEEYGISLEEIGSSPEEPSHYLNGDRIIIYYTISGRGFYITPQLAKIQSQQSSLSTQYKEDDKVRLAFVVEKRTEGTENFKTRLIYMYINGVLSGVSKYPEGDSFKQTPAKFITVGSNDATLDIYNIRIYNNNLTRKQIVNNWIADTKDPVLKTKRYKFNDNFNDEGKIIIDQDTKQVKGLTMTPYMVLTGPNLPAYKKDRKYMLVEYVNPVDDSRNFTSTDARVDVQGTSSQYYYKKNFKIKYEQGFEDKNGNWTEHYKIRGEDSKKEKTFTYKADVASSEGANNVELVRYFEDTKNWFSPAELEPDEDIPGSVDSKKRIRVGIDGFPIVTFWNDGNETKFYGKMNFNNDKGNERTFGFKDGDECWEFVNNSTPLVLFKDNDLTEWSSSFEGRFPEEVGADEHPYGTLPSERAKLQSIVDWIVSTYRKDTDSEAEKARKLAKFRAEFEQHFDLKSSLFYYLYTELFLMVDSRAKNAMLTYLKSRQPGDGGDKWFWFPYDMDTALGINNEGLLVFNYDKEDTDHQEGANIYNGQESTFWNNLRDAFGPELKKMYAELRTASGQDKVAWSYENAEKYFEDHQSFWSENVFNEDAYVKYLEPYVLNQDATYLGMAQGSKLQQRRWWMYNRFKYLDSKYLAGDALKDTIMFRAYVAKGPKPSLTVTPYQNLYVAALYRNGDVVTPIRAEKGKPVLLKNPVEDDATETDQETIIYSASQLMDIGDISVFRPGYADFSAATKLQRLQIGSAKQSYENANLKMLNVGANHLLTYLDARNCTNLGTEPNPGEQATQTIDLSQCYSIEEVYFDNTQIKGCSFPVGGNLKIVHLPATLTSLTIRNHPNLREFKLEGTQNLTSLWLEDVPSEAINTYEYVMGMPKDATVRLIGINTTVDSLAELQALYNKLNEDLHGLDSKGDYLPKAQITGTIHIATIPYAEYVRLSAMFPEVTIDPEIIVCTVRFYEADGTTVYATQNLTQGGAARFPKCLVAKPSDWDNNVEWDWKDGYAYDETAHDFVDASHNHYNNYYKIVNRTSFEPVKSDEEFVQNLYYKAPEKLSTEDKYYLFTNWDKSLVNIQTDLEVYPVYEEHDRHFAVESDTRTSLITSMPKIEDVVYGHYAHRSALSELPPQVTLIRWYDSTTGETFSYDSEDVGSRSTDIITSNRHLIASWNDSGKPVFEDVSRVDYKTIHYRAVDNVGITAFAVTNTPEIPSEWTQIESTPVLDGLFTVTHAGSWYFWIKDSNNNINEELSFLTCHSISRQLADGITSITLKENSIDIGDFALSGTRAELDFANDFHYEFIDADGIFVNGEKRNKGDMIVIDSQKSITSSISPKSYVVNFNLCGKGDSSKAPAQLVKYKTHIERPSEQYYKGFVIGKYYLEFEEGYYSKEWDFDNDVLDERLLPTQDIKEITLYAEWESATMPTTITVNVPETIPNEFVRDSSGKEIKFIVNKDGSEISKSLTDKEVTVVYSQSDANATTIDWGDGSFEEVQEEGKVRRAHTYQSAGVYNIKVEKKKDFGETVVLFGENKDNVAVNPSKYIIDVDFSYDIVTTNSYAFFNTSISNLRLTPYMTSIASAAFESNKLLTSLVIPEGISSIDSYAFESCSNIETITFPTTLTSIRSTAFGNCSSLREAIGFGDTKVTTMGDDVFISCLNLEEIILPETLRSMGSNIRGCIFRYDSSLKHVVIKSSILNVMGPGTFGGCSSLKSAGPLGSGADIEFAWVESIPDYAFCGQSFAVCSIETLELPNTIKYIGKEAFSWCTKLKSLRLPSYIETINERAFSYDSSLTRLSVPSTLKYLGYAAFARCSLSDISIYSIQIEAQKTVENESPAEKAWFWGNPTSLPAATVHLLRTITSVDDARAIYGYYWNFISETEYIGWVADL